MAVGIQPPKPVRLRMKLRALLWSWDFIAAVTLTAICVVPALLVLKAPPVELANWLFAISAIGAGLAGLVLAAGSLIVAALSTNYRKLLRGAEGGTSEVLRPTIQVVVLGISSSASALAFAILVSSTLLSCVPAPWTLLTLVVPLLTGFWAMFGTIQVGLQSMFHVASSEETETTFEAGVASGLDPQRFPWSDE